MDENCIRALYIYHWYFYISRIICRKFKEVKLCYNVGFCVDEDKLPRENIIDINYQSRTFTLKYRY